MVLVAAALLEVVVDAAVLAQAPTAVGGGQFPKKHPISLATSFQALVRSLVKSRHSLVTSERITPGIYSMSWMILPSSMSLKTLAASVATVSAAVRISSGSVVTILKTSLNCWTASCGRFCTIDGTWPTKSCSKNCSA